MHSEIHLSFTIFLFVILWGQKKKRKRSIKTQDNSFLCVIEPPLRSCSSVSTPLTCQD